MAGGGKALILSELNILQESCRKKIESEKGDYQFLSKSLFKCQAVTEKFPSGSLSSGQTKYYLQQFAEAVLDYTYHDENLLAEQKFPETDTRDRIAEIFGYFDRVKTVCEKIYPGKDIQDVVGCEIAECLLWRRGALLYMYCSTVQEDKERLSKNLLLYKQDLRYGVQYLQRIFKVRDPVLKNTPLPRDGDPLGLLIKGIYSDTHLLACMYGGEMCYWYLTAGRTKTDTDFDAKSLGRDMLQTYIKAVTTVAELQDWNTQRAEALLKVLS